MRKALILSLMCAAALTACGKEDGESTGGPAPGAQPLLAGPDEGAKPGDPNYVEGFSKGEASAGNDAAAGATGAPGAPGGAGMGAGGPGGGAPRVAVAAADGSKAERKPGLWQISTTMSGPPMGFPGGGRPGGAGAPGGQGRPGGGGGGGGGRGGPGGGGMNGTLCVTAESEAQRGLFSARGGANCAPKLVHNGATWTMSSVCTRDFQGNTMTTKTNATLSGDLSTKYTLRTTTTNSGAPAEMAMMNATRTQTQTGTYKGPCPAGAQGGDFTGTDGEKRNILQGGGGGFGGRG